MFHDLKNKTGLNGLGFLEFPPWHQISRLVLLCKVDKKKIHFDFNEAGKMNFGRSHMNFIILRTFSITCYNMSNLSNKFLYQFHICLLKELQQLVRKPLRKKLLEGLLNLEKWNLGSSFSPRLSCNRQQKPVI